MEGFAQYFGLFALLLLTTLASSVGSQVVSLTDINFEDRIFSGTAYFVLFYAPW